MEKIFLDELADILHAENMLVKALPKMREAAFSPELKAAFDAHLAETREHVARLEGIFRSFDLPAREKKCEGMVGLLVEGQHLMQRSKPSPALDAALLCAARKVEAFEGVSYSSLAKWAALLEQEEAAERLEETFKEEERMGKRLMQLSGKALRRDAFLEPEPA